MSGYFISNPWEGEDWSGKGRQTFYIDMSPDHIFHPEKTEILSTQLLSEVIPDFDWSGGHSGRMLTQDQADKLEELWNNFLTNVDENLYDNHLACRKVYLQPKILYYAR